MVDCFPEQIDAANVGMDHDCEPRAMLAFSGVATKRLSLQERFITLRPQSLPISLRRQPIALADIGYRLRLRLSGYDRDQQIAAFDLYTHLDVNMFHGPSSGELIVVSIFIASSTAIF